MLKNEFSLICFDLDGTLANTSEGICASYLFTCKQLKIYDETVMVKLNGVIGRRPIDVFQERWGLDQKTAEMAVGIYRNYYEKNGIFRATLYPGIEEFLCLLHEQGYLLAVTTLKYGPFAKIMLEHLGIAKYFDEIYGCDVDNLDTKAVLIQKAMTQFQKRNTQTILIGDSEVDALGASAAGVAFIGVTYGLGFRTEEEASSFRPYGIVKNSLDFSSSIFTPKPMFFKTRKKHQPRSSYVCKTDTL